MSEIGLTHYLLLGAVLFVCGVVCMATKRNAIGILMGVELVLNGGHGQLRRLRPLQPRRSRSRGRSSPCS